MNKKKEFAKNTIVLMIGRICTQFISFALLPLYTAFLKTDEYGTVDLIITYVNLFVPIITLQLEMALFRFLIDARKSEENKKSIITNTFYTISLLVACITIVYICVIQFVDFQFKIYAICMIVATIYSNFMLQLSRGNGDNVGYAVGSIAAGVGTILFNILFLVFLRWNAESILLSQTLANLICIIILALRTRIIRYVKRDYVSKEQIRKLLKYSMPLVPNGIIWWIINVSDRTIISLFMGTGSNGIYAISNKFSNVFMQIYGVFNMSWTESISLHLFEEDGNKFLSEMMEQLLKMFFSLCIIIILGISIVFPFFINKAYHESYYYIPLLMLGSFFTIIVSMLGAIYVAMKKTKEVAKTSLYAGIINIVINLLCIKFVGIYAAAISTVISFLVMAIYRWYDVKKYVDLRINIKIFIYMFVVYTLSVVIYYINNIIINCTAFIIISACLVLFNKDILKSIEKSIMSKLRRGDKK